MQPLRDRAVRARLGIDERSAAAVAGVSRSSLRKHDAGVLRDARCCALLEAFHADLRAVLERAEMRASAYDEDIPLDPDDVYAREPKTLPPPASARETAA